MYNIANILSNSNYVRAVGKFLIYKLVVIIHYLTRWFLKDKNVVLMTRHRGGLSENTKALYKWYQANEDDKIVFWLTHDQDIRERLSIKGYSVLSPLSIKGIYYVAQANVAITTHSYFHIAPYGLLDSTTKINLSHGNPVKYSSDFSSRAGKVTNASAKDDIMITTSEFAADMHQKRNPNHSVKFAITGYPRNDILHDNKGEIESYTPPDEMTTRASILYAPTQRQPKHLVDCEPTDVFPYDDFDINKLEKILRDTDSHLFIHLHPSDHRRLLAEPENHPTTHHFPNLLSYLNHLDKKDRITFLDSRQTESINVILRHTDILVTDYSSIYHDYVLLDRQIIFTPYDYTKFEHDFGFVYDYNSHRPGPKVDSFEEFIKELESTLANPAQGEDQRSQFTRLYHKYRSGSYSYRVSKLVDSNC